MTKVGEHITLDIIGTTQEYDPFNLRERNS